jgi:hypothetical protein
MGYELVDGIYVEVSPDENGGFRSSSLGLDFHLRDEGLGIYDPVANEWVRTRAEAEAIRADTAETRTAQEAMRADTAEARTAQEAAARQEAEAEAEKLREQIARLQART